MKLKGDVLLSEADDCVIAVATGTESRFNGMVRLNSTAGFVANLMTDEITEDEIVEKLTETYDVTEEVARENVKKVVDGFRKIGFLQE